MEAQIDRSINLMSNVFLAKVHRGRENTQVQSPCPVPFKCRYLERSQETRLLQNVTLAGYKSNKSELAK